MLIRFNQSGFATLLVLIPVIAALCLTSPGKAGAAISFDLGLTQVGTADSVDSWTHTVSGRETILIVSVAVNAVPVTGVNGVTFNGAPLTKLDSQDAEGKTAVDLWYLVNPDVGAHLVSVDLTGGSGNDYGALSMSFACVDQTTPFGTHAKAFGDSSLPSVNVSSAAGELVVDTVTTEKEQVSVDPGQTLRTLIENGNRHMGGSTKPGAASTTMSWSTPKNTKWAVIAVPLKPFLGYTISGTVFEDGNFAGTASDYEGAVNDQPLTNVDVEIYDSSDVYIDSTATDANGTYSFTCLVDGTYKVRVRSATIGDADTLPKGGLNATVPGTWPYPLPEMTWGNGIAMYGGQSATVDDNSTADNTGPGDTYANVTVSGSGVSDVNFGFAYNLVVNTLDDANSDNSRSSQGSLRQFMKNANAIGTTGGTTANSSQFRIPAGLGVASIAPVAALPTISDTSGGTIIDGTTQTTNIGDTNAGGPEVELDGTSVSFGTSGLVISAGNCTIRGLVINRFNNGYGIQITTNGGNTIAGNYIGISADGTSLATSQLFTGVIIDSTAANTIGGSSAIDRNVISGSIHNGIKLTGAGATGNIIRGNFIGTNSAGDAPIANENGINVYNAPGNTIGGTTAGERNLISGSTMWGIYLSGALTSGNAIQGNYIGTNAAGNGAIANQLGVLLTSGSNNNTIGGTLAGEGNLISRNRGYGVGIADGTGNAMLGNSMYSNGSIGIDLDPYGVTANDTGDADTGPNNLQNFPVLTLASTLGGVTTVEGSLNSTASTTFRIEFFSSPVEDPLGYGEGETYLGFTTVTTDGDGNQDFTFITSAPSVPVGYVVTATATDPNNNTSEFSKAETVTGEVRGTVFEDANFAGTASDYEGAVNDQPLANVDVEVYDNSDVYITSTTTIGDGTYSFTGLADGTYKVRVRSATIGDADTLPKGGLNATVPGTWPYPLPEMTWGNGVAMYGGQSATVDDNSTADNTGPGDTYVAVTVSGADVSNVNVGFAYNLIVNTDDDSNADNVRSKQGSLRQFMKNANGITGADVSYFAIAAPLVGGVHTIQPTIELPATTDPVGIDGTTEPDYAGTPMIVLDGSFAGLSTDGLTIEGGNSTVRGLVIQNFSGNGIRLDLLGSNTVAGNYIGTDPTGMLEAGNGAKGILLYYLSIGNTIGGTSAEDRNVISGNDGAGIFVQWSENNFIKGNYIGINAGGDAALGNGAEGVYIFNATGNTVGGTLPGAGNVISGNATTGIFHPSGDDSTVQGNLIGTNAAGTADLGNGQHGIFGSGGNVQIGGTAASAGNLISGNGRNGIYFQGYASFIQGNSIGTDAAGTGSLRNDWAGIRLDGTSAFDNMIGGITAGAGNLVAFNNEQGVLICGAEPLRNQVVGNSIHSNGGLGIDLGSDFTVTPNDDGDPDTGANNLQNFPVLTLASRLDGVTTVEGSLNSAASTTFRIEFFSSPAEDPSGYGEGQTYLGSTNITTDGSGDQTFTFPTSVPLGQVITATATDPNNNTSEFSNAKTVLEGNDIAIDCTFSDWTDVDGTEFIVDDEGGQDDWWTPSNYDITRFGVASNLSDTFYLLFGFDDISPEKTCAAVLIDTDLDNNINYALTVAFDNSGASEVELFTCDDSIPYGCGNQTLSTTYTTPGDYCVGTGTGPWNTDTFVEVQFPYSDLPLFTGGSSILTSLISHQKVDLTKPKDSIYADYYDRTLYDTNTGEGETIGNAGTPTIAGTVFTDEGMTSVGIGKTVRLLDNGAAADLDTTDDDGYWFMVVPSSAADNLLAYIDDNDTYKGATVTVFDGTLLSDLDIYAGHVITRHDNGGTLSTANMASAKGGDTDSDILYSVSGGTNLSVTGSGTELYVPTGYSYAPGGDVTTPSMENLGTFTGGTGAIDINGTLTLTGGSFTSTSGNLSVAGDFTHAGGTFSHNSGTVSLDGTGQTISGSTTFNTLSKTVAATDTLTFTAGSTQTIAGTVTLTGADGNRLSLRSSSDGTRWNFTIPASATKDISYVDVKDSDASGSDATQKPISPATSVDSGNCIDWFSTLPDIIMVKSVQTFSDPYNGEANPKAIPGAVMFYTVAATNQGAGATDTDTVFITDPIPANTALFVGDINGVGSGPVLFTDGTSGNESGLSYTFDSLSSVIDDVAFSNDGGTTYTYVPASDGDGFDTNVTHMRINPTGAFKAASGGDIPTFNIKFKVRVE